MSYLNYLVLGFGLADVIRNNYGSILVEITFILVFKKMKNQAEDMSII